MSQTIAIADDSLAFGVRHSGTSAKRIEPERVRATGGSGDGSG